jgi:zinc protease
VIGWASDLQHLQVEDLRDWYRKWYAPNNATLVVVGDVEPEAVFALAADHFGPLAPETVTAPKARGEPTQRGEKRIKVKIPAKEPYVVLGYKATALGHAEEDWEPYALEMLASVLDGGASARLSRELVRGSEVAASAGASYSAFSRLPGMLLLDGIPAEGSNIVDLEHALRGQVARLRDEPVADDELERIRTQLIAAKVYEKDSVYAQAMQLGRLETVGLGWPLVDTYVDHLSRVTPEQIQAVAKRYLVDDSLTVAVLVPQPMNDARPHPAAAGGHAHVR